jgi:hypothetical protein
MPQKYRSHFAKKPEAPMPDIEFRKEFCRVLREVIAESVESLSEWAKCRVSIQGESLAAGLDCTSQVNETITDFNRYQKKLETTNGEIIGVLENLFDSTVEITELVSTGGNLAGWPLAGGHLERRVSGELGWNSNLIITSKTAVKIAKVNRFWNRLYQSGRMEQQLAKEPSDTSKVTAKTSQRVDPAQSPTRAAKYRPLQTIDRIVIRLFEDGKKPSQLDICTAFDKENAEEHPGKPSPCLIPKRWVDSKGSRYSRWAVALDEIPLKVKPYLSKITRRLRLQGLIK